VLSADFLIGGCAAMAGVSAVKKPCFDGQIASCKVKRWQIFLQKRELLAAWLLRRNKGRVA
jgi:hypothetical protein